MKVPLGQENMVLAQIVNIIYDHGPISAADIGERINRSREYVDVYIRQARDLRLVRVSGRSSTYKRPIPVMLFVFGKGRDSRKRVHIGPPRVPNKKVEEVFTPRHDPALLALFGRLE